jgi:hypothetical protein
MQYEIIEQLLTLGEKQYRIFADVIMFEQSILCHQLADFFKSLKACDQDEQCTNKHAIIHFKKRRRVGIF